MLINPEATVIITSKRIAGRAGLGQSGGQERGEDKGSGVESSRGVDADPGVIHPGKSLQSF